MSGLVIDGVSVRLGKHQVLGGVSVDSLPEGSVSALLGPNGSGKSTLLRVLAGLVRAQRGSVTLDGDAVRLTVAGARSHDIVYLPQALPAGVGLQVIESVLVARRAGRRPLTGGLSPVADIAQAHAVLVSLGIAALAWRRLDELSGGQRQLVGIAQALARDPHVLLLDEPMSALDQNHQFQVMQRLREVTRERGLVTVVVMHDINAAMRTCDRATLLHRGRVVASGSPPEVITPERLAEVFGVSARIESCSRGYPHVLIDGLAD